MLNHNLPSLHLFHVALVVSEFKISLLEKLMESIKSCEVLSATCFSSYNYILVVMKTTAFA